MLESMIKGDQEGNNAHLMKYPRATTAQAFFLTANDWLTSLSN
jgi:hypothetical protein